MSQDQLDTEQNVLLARQPIVNVDLELVAYELLYRAENLQEAALSGDQATRKVLVNTLTASDLDKIVGSSLAFINMTRQTILEIENLGIPPERVILEILEDVNLDPDLLQKIEELKTQGYRFALDDFTLEGIHTEHVPLSEVVKVDILDMSEARIREHAEKLLREGVELLAEKVETWEQYEICKDAGFTLFQGYFYARPQVMTGSEVQQLRSSTMTLVAKLQDPDVGIGELEELISKDPAISYKLFKYAHSAAFSRGREFSKINEVIVLLGLDRLRSVATLFTLSSLGDKPEVLTESVLRRAFLCQSLAEQVNNRPCHEYFTLGMFSMLDAYLDRPLEELLENLPLDSEIKQAILERNGAMGKLLTLSERIESLSLSQFASFTGEREKYVRLHQDATQKARNTLLSLH